MKKEILIFIILHFSFLAFSFESDTLALNFSKQKKTHVYKRLVLPLCRAAHTKNSQPTVSKIADAVGLMMINTPSNSNARIRIAVACTQMLSDILFHSDSIAKETQSKCIDGDCVRKMCIKEGAVLYSIYVKSIQIRSQTCRQASPYYESCHVHNLWSVVSHTGKHSERV